MVEKISVPQLGIPFPKQVLGAPIDHAFVRLGFASATDNQKEVLSEFVRGRDVLCKFASWLITRIVVM